jgi:tight adherence protein C
MVLALILGLILAALATVLLAHAATFPRARVSASVGRIESYGFETQVVEEEPVGGLRAIVDGLAAMVGAFVAPRMTSDRQAKIRGELLGAGFYRLSPRKFLGYRVLAAAAGLLVGLWIATRVGTSTALSLFFVFGLTAAGWWLPLVSMRSRAERRLARIDYELPEMIDVLIVTVEAGLGFTASLQLAAREVRGPLADELRLALQEQRMGLSTNESLRNMLARANTPAMESFVRSILQGETLGVSIGQIMRELALEMRKRRRAAAEERAHKAPIKLLFPLVFLIFPAMFIILLGPAVFAFFETVR